LLVILLFWSFVNNITEGALAFGIVGNVVRISLWTRYIVQIVGLILLTILIIEERI